MWIKIQNFYGQINLINLNLIESITSGYVDSLKVWNISYSTNEGVYDEAFKTSEEKDKRMLSLEKILTGKKQ